MGSRCDEPIWRAVPIAPTALLEGRAVELSLSQIALIAPAATSSTGTWPTLSSSGALRAIDVPAKGSGSAERLPRRARAQRR